MLPVAIVPEAASATASATKRHDRDPFAGGARVCVRGEVSAETLRQVVELLR